MIHMYEYITHPHQVTNTQSKLHLENLGFYPCSSKWVGFQKFDKGDFWAFSKDIFISSAVG